MTDRRRASAGSPKPARLGALRLLISTLLALAATSSLAAEFTVGELIQPFQLYDQHDALHEVDADTRIILFSRDMKGGDLLKAALNDVSKTFLSERDAVYVSDISGMPRIIAKLFALPSMRRRPYSMLLDRDGTSTQIIPDVEGQATLVFLNALQVDRIEHVSTADDITRLLSSPPAEAALTPAPAEPGVAPEPSVSSAPSEASPKAPAE